MKTSHRYRRACEVLIRVKLRVFEKLALPIATVSPTVGTPMSSTANVISFGDISLICTSHFSCGVIASLSGPLTMQVMVKLSPAVGIPGIEVIIVKSSSLSAANFKTARIHYQDDIITVMVITTHVKFDD